jgi:hypothetical protein
MELKIMDDAIFKSDPFGTQAFDMGTTGIPTAVKVCDLDAEWIAFALEEQAKMVQKNNTQPDRVTASASQKASKPATPHVNKGLIRYDF